MTSPGWPEIVDRLHDTLIRCDRNTDLELAAGARRLHLMVRRGAVRGVCPAYDERRLAHLGWRPPRGGSGWWYETPRTAEGLRWWSVFVSRTAAAVLTDDPGALSCQVLPPTGPRVRPHPTLPPPARGATEPPPAPPATEPPPAPPGTPPAPPATVPPSPRTTEPPPAPRTTEAPAPRDTVPPAAPAPAVPRPTTP